MRYCQVCHRCFGDGAEYCLFDQTPTFLVDQLPVVIDGKYRLEQLIAHGGMGSVYRAVHQQLERNVAIKILRAEFLADQIIAERFNREARAAAKLKHPNIVAIYDFGFMLNGGAYLVMELIEGRSLREELRTHSAGHGQMRPERAVMIMTQVCAGIESAHRQGIVHRDLKPDNVMIETTAEATERVLVLDFGIAKLKDRDQGLQSITDENTIIGTPNYISPEQCTGQPIDARSDIYSLGVILYEMLTGRTPFADQNTSATLLRHLQEPPTPPTRFRLGLARELEQVVLRALAKNPNHRFSSAAQFAEHLSAAVRSSRHSGEYVEEEFDESDVTLVRRLSPIPDELDELTGIKPNPFTSPYPGPFTDERLDAFQPFGAPMSASGNPTNMANMANIAGNESTEIVRIADAEVRSPSFLIEGQSRVKFNAAVVIAVLALLSSIGYLLLREWRAKADETGGAAALKSSDSNSGPGSGSPSPSYTNPAASSSGDTNGLSRPGEAEHPNGSGAGGSAGGKTLPAAYVKNDAKTDVSSSGSVGGNAGREVKSVYDQWVKSAVGGNWDKHLSFYANRVDYFRDGKLTREQVKARKRRVFGGLDSYSLKFTQSPQIRLRQSSGAQMADIRFVRQWTLKRNRRKIEGRAQGTITLRRESHGWRIISEKQIK
jgi:serine/threonine protein kinase